MSTALRKADDREQPLWEKFLHEIEEGEAHSLGISIEEYEKRKRDFLETIELLSRGHPVSTWRGEKDRDFVRRSIQGIRNQKDLHRLKQAIGRLINALEKAKNLEDERSSSSDRHESGHLDRHSKY